ncbi:MAG TPA: hypothetical protein VJM34_00835 [Novosphingobium sp.]|nr:hypothetical protein [Novosphingobium sp.]
MLKRLLSGLAAIFLSLSLIAPAHAKGWLRADTPHFVIYSEGSDAETREFALDVERFDALLRQMFEVPDHEEPNRLTIYMLKSAGTVAKLYGQKYVAGFYSPDAEGSYAVTNRVRSGDKLQLTGQITLFHEYAHHFMYRNFTNAYPAWYREGFAEFVSTATFDKKGNWKYGFPAMHRAYDLLTTQIPIEKVLFSERYEFKDREQADFYAWSWALVHMLTWSDTRKGQLADYITRFAAGAGPEEAAKVFGDLDKLQSDLRRYATGRMSYLSSGAPIVWSGKIAVTPLDPITSDYVELSLARRMGGTPLPTRNALRALSARAPGNADVLFELAQAERNLVTKDDPSGYALAGAAVDQALAIAPRHMRANVLKAELEMHRLGDGKITDPAQWKAMRQFIGTANRADPKSPVPLIAYFQTFMLEGRKPTPLALAGIASAFAQQPESREVRLLYVLGLANDKQFALARGLLTVLVYDPHASEVGKKALAVLDRMERQGLSLKAATKAVEEAEKAESKP